MSMDMKVTLAGVSFKNPIITASGTFGFGREYSEFYDLSELGGVTVKGLTLEPRLGNPAPRIAETPMGMLNSVGLQNPGVEEYIRKEVPFLRQFDTKILVNISGKTVEEYAEMSKRLNSESADLIEVNISCPNVQAGGMAFGTSPDFAYQITQAVKSNTDLPVIVKLSPNVTDITEIAKAAEAGGADGLSLINTLLGMRINLNTGRPILKRNVGGLSGPAVFPVAIRMIWQVANSVSIPILGMGGVASGEDAAEMMMAGATLVAVGTQSFTDPLAPVHIRDGLLSFCEKHHIEHVSDLIGAVKPW